MKKKKEKDKLKDKFTALTGQELSLSVKSTRGKTENISGVLSAANDNIVVLNVNDGVRSHICLSYGDIISGRAKVEEIK